MTKEIAKTKRLQLILQNRAKNYKKTHLLFTEKGMYCSECHKYQEILYPISIEYLQSLMEIFKTIHSHEFKNT